MRLAIPVSVPTGVERRMGITPDQYRARQEAGKKWCSGCRAWHLLSAFNGSVDTPDLKQRGCREWQRRYREMHKKPDSGARAERLERLWSIS
jgi:hypothetical protein